MYTEADKLNKLLDRAKHIVVIQADNPDADSLGSALVMESILADLGKEVSLYCAVDMPTYLRYMQGWDRVESNLPKQFDASIIVDASTLTLLEKLEQSGQLGWLKTRPCAVLDHHELVENEINFAEVLINDSSRASTGELIYKLATQLNWSLSKQAQGYVASSILGDTQGLTNQLASAETYRIMAEMIESGFDRPALEELRRQFGKMEPEIFKYKAELIKRTELVSNGRIATVTVPQAEINMYSPLYNPAPLIQNDMLQIKDVELAIVFKHYADGKITGAIRSGATAPIAAELAEHLGGGGHAFASGFKVHGQKLEAVKSQCVEFASERLDKIKNEEHEAI